MGAVLGLRWALDLSTADEQFTDGSVVIAPREDIVVEARSISLLRRVG